MLIFGKIRLGKGYYPEGMGVSHNSVSLECCILFCIYYNKGKCEMR